jgi:hypothetical protein
MLIVLVFIYRAIPSLVLPDLTAGHTTLTIPYQEILPGDYLLARHSQAGREHIGRGSLVLTHLAQTRNQRSRKGQEMIVQVVGLPGETLEITDNVFVVDGRQLDTEKYPVPGWLHNRKLSVKIENERYFINCDYRANVRGGLPDGAILAVCIVPLADIRAQAFMRWLPLSRRAYLKAME